MTLREKLGRLIYLALQRYKVVPKDRRHYTKMAQKVNIVQLYGNIKNLPGCVVECGVARGESLALLKMLSMAEGKERKLFGFDTFTGLPEPSMFEPGAKGQFVNTQGRVWQFFKDTGTPMDGVTLIAGDIRDTLKDFKETIAFLHIDVDLYEGYKAALGSLWDRMAPGGVVVLDDYGHHWSGCNKAVNEFLVARPHVLLQKAEFANKFYLIK